MTIGMLKFTVAKMIVNDMVKNESKFINLKFLGYVNKPDAFTLACSMFGTNSNINMFSVTKKYITVDYEAFLANNGDICSIIDASLSNNEDGLWYIDNPNAM